MYFVYMLRCRGGSLYTGIAADMEKTPAAARVRRRGLRKIHAGAPARGPCRTLSGGGPRSRCTAGSADQDASAHKKALSGRRTDSAGGCFRREAERPFISPLFRRGIAFERAAGYAVTAARPRCAGPIFQRLETSRPADVVGIWEIRRHAGIVFDGVRVDALCGAPFEKRLAEECVQVLHGAVEIDLLIANKEDCVYAAAREQAPLALDLAVAELLLSMAPGLIEKALVS